MHGLALLGLHQWTTLWSVVGAVVVIHEAEAAVQVGIGLVQD